MTQTISTQNLRDAFKVNDLEVMSGTSIPDLLATLGLEDSDGVFETLIERLDTTDLNPNTDTDMGLYIDGIAATLRAVELAVEAPNAS